MWIRQMLNEDIDKLADIEKNCFRCPWSNRLIKDMFENDIDKVWVLENDNRLIGYVNIRIVANQAELMRICITTDKQGMGLSKLLMYRVDDYLKSVKISDITLEVRKSNIGAIALYKQFGFVCEAVRENYYTCPNEDAFIMWRREILC